MPIISSQFSSSVQSDGSLLVDIVLFDQDGTSHPFQFPASAGFNIAAKVAVMTAELNEQLAQSEMEALIGL